MTPIEFNLGRHDNDRFGHPPHPQHRSFPSRAIFLAVLVVLLAGGTAAMGLSQARSDANQAIAATRAAAAGLQSFITRLIPTTAAYPRDTIQQKAIGGAGPASPSPAHMTPVPQMAIVPAPVIDPGAGHFVGTGDGSNGAWTRP